ncbi:sigma-70 family RNA polymerase sigma factor [Mariniblastus fucicola]|uniref:ECF RNA polymerase sigma-E factor n=1 Tax=Mariniblastus fucicola TaxID=980251 RepID=A0A5B9P4A7_9BACT|nr:sigma-70 family RNA polymerase sigma factor [Mariniblastus fucicola]QEG21457.1 ECF RNA polymerase sigma-E factor [Mariniblastus fucicola]
MSESSYPTLSLLHRAREGDGSSLGILLRKYFRYLNSLSHGHLDDRIGVRVSASDIVQDTLLEAHRDFGKFSGTTIEEFTGWLRRILFNNLATAIEKHVLADKRDVRKQRSLDQEIGPADQSHARLAKYLQQDATSPSTPMQRDESLDQLLLAINTLPSDYQTVIRMRHFDDLSFAQIAKQLDRNSGAVRMMWVRAIEKLRVVLKRLEDNHDA